MNAISLQDGSIIVKGDTEHGPRDFMLDITEASEEKQKEIIDNIYNQTQRIILLVRDRLEREKPFESQFSEYFKEEN